MTVKQKAEAIVSAGGVELFRNYAVVKGGSARHIVTEQHSGELRCSCDWQRHNPGREGCSHALAARIEMEKPRDDAPCQHKARRTYIDDQCRTVDVCAGCGWVRVEAGAWFDVKAPPISTSFTDAWRDDLQEQEDIGF